MGPSPRARAGDVPVRNSPVSMRRIAFWVVRSLQIDHDHSQLRLRRAEERGTVASVLEYVLCGGETSDQGPHHYLACSQSLAIAMPCIVIDHSATRIDLAARSSYLSTARNALAVQTSSQHGQEHRYRLIRRNRGTKCLIVAVMTGHRSWTQLPVMRCV